VTLLATETLRLGDGDALQADFLQRLFHLIELERLNDRFDLLHLDIASAWGKRAIGPSRTTLSTKRASPGAPDATLRKRRPHGQAPQFGLAASHLPCFQPGVIHDHFTPG